MGSVSVAWQEVRSLEATFATRWSVWMTLRMAAGAKVKSMVIPGPPFSEREWNRLFDELGSYFDEAGIDVRLGP